jgi:mono/diheme cytochrome c family protein
MSDLAAAAAAIGLPEDLVRRSAEARAAAEGVSVDDLLTAWAGGAAAPAGSPAPRPDSSDETDEPPTEEAAPETPEAEPAPAAPSVPTSPGVVASAPVPETVSGAAAFDYTAVITVPTAGLSERTASVIPRWLGLLFVWLPLIGLTYLITYANGPNCGVGGQLTVDRLTGAVENCDGTEYVAAGAALGVDVRAIILDGAAIYSAPPGNCTTCHGAAGQGGTGPALNGAAVLATFAACTDHLEWVSLATTGFQAAGLSMYGDQDKTVGAGGQMTGFASSLTADQIAAVVFYERVQFGGQDPADAAVDCGYVTPEDYSENVAEAESPADGE